LQTESLKISSDHDMHDWFYDRDVKDPAVILHDKLISDALLNGTGPIKTEHSYSLNSDGDSLPDSPKSLQAKIDDMDDECYSGSGRITIDPKCLTLHPPARNSRSSSSAMLSMSCASASPALNTAITSGSHNELPHHGGSNKNNSASSISGSSSSSSASNGNNHIVSLEHFQLPQHLAEMYDDNDCSSSVSSAREGSISPDICSDIEIDEAVIKDEPMSPDSSCPASPNSQNSSVQQQLSLSLANLQSELLFDQKHGGLLLTTGSSTGSSSSSNSNLIKSQQQQQHLLGPSGQTLMLPKMAIKSEKQSSSSSSAGKSHAYGIPLTPPSSLPSDDSEGNLSPEHLYAPLSPNASVSISAAGSAAATGDALHIVGSGRRAAAAMTRAAASSSNGASSNATSTRQPIHTPLISSQPKGSTGTLLLTEEEKRTLLAEGYPIPQKLPLTKAEEKSLKKIRRKIKNKISAQESRRKKKEYMDQLERRVEILVTENHDYKKRLETLEETNANLLSQLHKLQALVSKHNVKKS
ncbi:hypothetical protein KR222_006619, partial [Zaprionus bogoriensis]